MLRAVNVGHKSLADYPSIVSRDLMDEVRRLAAPLEGKRILHVSATSFGGGVSEILYSLVPLMNDAGLRADWKVMYGKDEFFNVTKAIHNALQGNPIGLSAEDKAIYERYNLMNVGGLTDEYDVVIIHDAQPAAMRLHAPETAAKWIFRCHIDLSTPNRQVLEFLMPMLAAYDLSVFHMAQYIPPGGRVPDPVVMPPAIDPLAPKNMSLSAEDAAYIVDQFGLDVERPLMLQVSRFDPWKDPLGVIDAYRLVQAEGARAAARPGRLDGHRRPGGLGVLQPDHGLRGRGPGHLHPVQPEQRGRGRGQRLPDPGRRWCCRSRSARASA